MNTLKVIITPSFESTRNSMGYSEDEDYNSDAVLFQQGYNMDVMEVEPDETFQISEDYEGQINCEETQYKFIKIKDEFDNEFSQWDDDYYEEGDPINLAPGSYKFFKDGVTIEQLKKSDL